MERRTKTGMRGMCSNIWGWFGRRRNFWIGLISGILSSDMEISKLWNYRLSNYGLRSALKAQTPHTSQSTTHWSKIPIKQNLHCNGNNRRTLHQKQPNSYHKAMKLMVTTGMFPITYNTCLLIDTTQHKNHWSWDVINWIKLPGHNHGKARLYGFGEESLRGLTYLKHYFSFIFKLYIDTIFIQKKIIIIKGYSLYFG